MLRGLVFWFAGVASFASLGCSTLIEVDGPQCNSDVECTSRLLGSRCERHVCVGEIPYACTGGSCDAGVQSCSASTDCSEKAPYCLQGSCASVSSAFMCEPEKMTSGSAPATVSYSFRVVEYLSPKAPTNIDVRACMRIDVECVDPIATFHDSDGTGLVRLDLPTGFKGYLDVSSNLMHTRSYVSVPLLTDTMDRDLQLASTETVKALAMVAGQPLDPSKGVVLIEAFDCAKKPAGGIHFTEITNQSLPFYFVSQLPSPDAKETVYDESLNVSNGGFLNLPQGYVTFTAYLGDGGAKLGEFNAFISPNTVTYIDMYF